ncbi:hypothetical protein GCM10027569_09850 [Flindersiella endophytica]
MIEATTKRGQKPGPCTLPAALLATLLTGALLAGCGLNVDVDRTQAGSAPKPLADRGPAPGTYKQAWKVTASSGKQRASYRISGGTLLLATKTGVYAHDARTGKPTWHYSEPGRQVWSIAESDGAIALHTYQNVREDGSDRIRDEHLVGLDAGTGEELWESTKDWSILADGSTGSTTPPTWGDAADGVVAVEAESPFERAGIEARTGKKLWQVSDHDVAGACTDQRGAAGTGPILVTRLSCGLPKDVMVALDARTGKLRWRKALPSLNGPTVRTTTRDGVTLWDETDATPVLLGPDGKQLYAAPAGSKCSCDLLVTGGRALLSYRDDKARKDVLVSIDVRNGQATPISGWTSTLEGARTVAGGRLYELTQSVTQGFGASLLPSGLSVTDVAGGRLRSVPLPFAGTLFTQAEGQVLPSSWLGVSGDRLFLATQTHNARTAADPETAPVITSYAPAGTPEPLELGGVPASDWPDPCRLLAGLPPETEANGRMEPGEGVTVGSVRIPRLTCTASTDSSAGPISVQVLWVARSEREAAGLLKGVPPVLFGRANVLREGRVIVTVQAGDSTTMLAAAKQTVVRNLRALG